MQQDHRGCVLGSGVGDEGLSAPGQIKHRAGGKITQRVRPHEVAHAAPGALQQLRTHNFKRYAFGPPHERTQTNKPGRLWWSVGPDGDSVTQVMPFCFS